MSFFFNKVEISVDPRLYLSKFNSKTNKSSNYMFAAKGYLLLSYLSLIKLTQIMKRSSSRSYKLIFLNLKKSRASINFIINYLETDSFFSPVSNCTWSSSSRASFSSISYLYSWFSISSAILSIIWGCVSYNNSTIYK